MKKQPLAGAHARARVLRRNVTDAERQRWQILRLHQVSGYKFRRQVPLGRYIAGFICHEARLVIEVDGGQHAISPELEAERTEFLQHEGYRVLRFWNNEVVTNMDGVYEVIVNALAKPTPPPNPSPIKGEGHAQRRTAPPP